MEKHENELKDELENEMTTEKTATSDEITAEAEIKTEVSGDTAEEQTSEEEKAAAEEVIKKPEISPAHEDNGEEEAAKAEPAEEAKPDGEGDGNDKADGEGDEKGETEADGEPEEEADPDAIEDEPFVKKYNPEKDRAIAEIAAYAERITGAPHSVNTTAAPIRTRTPEQNRNIENGIAHRPNTRVSQQATAERVQPSRSSQAHTNHPQKNGKNEKNEESQAAVKLLSLIVASMIVVAGILSSVIIVVNTVYSKNRPVDLEISSAMPENSELISLDSVDRPLDSDSSTATEPESDSESSAESESESMTETETEREVQYKVTLDFFDHEDIEISTAKITLSELFNLIDYTLPEYEIPELPLDAVIASDVTVKINRHEYKTDSTVEAIAFETETYNTDLIPRDTVNILQAGEVGEKTTTYTVEYINGEEVNRTVAGEEVTKWPVTEKKEVGVGGSFVGGDGVTYTYSYRKVVPATYYNIEGLTYLGTMADESVMAVDMNVIPLGTRLYVKNDKYDFGVRIASDIGGGVKGDLIDIWLSEDNPYFESFAFIGYHYDMEIYYID